MSKRRGTFIIQCIHHPLARGDVYVLNNRSDAMSAGIQNG